MSMVHPMARTTPRTRAEIHDSAASVSELAQAYNISSSTARKWRNRDDLLDRSHKAHQLHTTLSPAQELIVMEIRRLCLLPLDDLVAVTKQFINADASRSGVSRLLRREGLSKLSDLEPRVEDEETSRKTFKDYEPGFVHIDIKYLPKMPDEAQHSYLFVAIDRATRWVFMRIYADQTQGSAVDFLRRVHEAAAFKITKLLTDNGTQFTDRFTSKNKQASGRHSFDRQCKALEIEHRLSPPRRPQTNGMVERFNGRISEVIKQTRFASAAELASTLNNYWQAYNHHIPQRALGHVSPIDSLKNWHQKKPELFRKRIYKQAELDSYIAQLAIEGDPGKSEALLRELAAPLLAERPLRTATFERQSQLMARLPGIRTAASAQLPTTVDGATTLKLVTRHQPFTIGLSGELRRPTSRFVTTALVNDLLWGGSQLQVSALLRAWDTERYFSVAHTQLLNDQGTLLRVSASNYRNLDDAQLATQGYKELTRQRRVDLSVQHPWRLSSSESGLISGGFYGVNYARSYQFPSLNARVDEQERIRVLTGQFTWAQASARGSHSLQLSFAQGLSGLGARTARSNNLGAEMTPSTVKLSFTRLSFDASVRRRFGESAWGGAINFGGQLTPHRLPTPERISFGGSRYARGYQPGAVSADQGLGLGLEINRVFPTQSTLVRQWEPYLLYEVARTWQHQAGEVESRLRSASLGVRFAGGRSYSADVAMSKPLGDRTLDNPRRKLRLSLVLSYQFD